MPRDDFGHASGAKVTEASCQGSSTHEAVLTVLAGRVCTAFSGTAVIKPPTTVALGVLSCASKCLNHQASSSTRPLANNNHTRIFPMQTCIMPAPNLPSSTPLHGALDEPHLPRRTFLDLILISQKNLFREGNIHTSIYRESDLHIHIYIYTGSHGFQNQNLEKTKRIWAF